PALGNNAQTASTTVGAASADIKATKTALPPSPAAGTELTYTIGATNNGPSDAGTVTLTDAIPAQTTFVRLTNGGWDCGTTTPTIGGTGTLTCTIPSLASGAPSAILTLVVKLNSNASGTMNNTATAFSTTAKAPG